LKQKQAAGFKLKQTENGKQIQAEIDAQASVTPSSQGVAGLKPDVKPEAKPGVAYYAGATSSGTTPSHFVDPSKKPKMDENKNKPGGFGPKTTGSTENISGTVKFADPPAGQ
jgi:hypothetical protein